MTAATIATKKKLRSMLFVPADSEPKLAKAVSNPADALILDLEDSVAEARKIGARTTAAEFIVAQAGAITAQVFVRINPLTTPLAMGDLAAVVVPGLAGIMLPKAGSAADIVRLGHCLDALEARAGLRQGTVCIVPVATETAAAMLNMQSYVGPVPRLAAMTWGAEDLSAVIGAVSNREDDGALSPLYMLANSLCLCAATAAGVSAIDTLFADFRDGPGLAAACRVSRRRGFRGRIAIHPDQSAIINAAYAPTPQELAHAQRIVDAFASSPDAGTLSIDGLMVDRPHLTQALLTLAQSE